MFHRITISLAALALLAQGTGIPDALAQNPFLARDGKREIKSVTYFGNRITKEYILDRALQLKAGDPYDPMAVSDAWERLEQLDIIAYVDIQEKRPNPTEIHLVVQIEEDVRFALTPMVHYERRHDGFILGLDSSFRNFRGRDETIRFSTAWWKLHGYSLRWSNPHILGSARLGVFVDGSWMRYDFEYEPFRLTDFGGRVGLWREFGRWVRGELFYDHRQLKSDEDDLDLLPGTVHDPALQLNLGFDSRDLRYYPSNGVHANAAVRFAGLGQDDPYNIYSGSLSAFYQIPYLQILAGHVSLRGSDEALPKYERTYLGGPANLRGIDFGSIEGDRAYQASLELRYPLFLLALREGKAVGVGLHAFHDWGKAWESSADFDDAPLRYSRGLGIHFNFNTRNIRMEWARSDDGDNVFVFEDTLTF